jgi:rSAM/selenodomain-associated transferase 1
MRPVIILFAKAPIAGRVKTRLAPPLAAERAAELHAAMVADMIERLQQFPEADLELHTDVFTDAWADTRVPRALQHEGDLGLKMIQALERALAQGHARAMIVGSDAPALPLEHLRELLSAEEDVALGPTDDGGYYAIACRRTHPSMFDGVAWSMPDTRERTIAAARNCGLTVTLGRPWFDVDTPADLERLKTTPGLGRHTAKIVL